MKRRRRLRHDTSYHITSPSADHPLPCQSPHGSSSDGGERRRGEAERVGSRSCGFPSHSSVDQRSKIAVVEFLMVAITTYRAAPVLRAVILGAPASGKGTVSTRIVQQFDVAHISSGDRLRLHVSVGTNLGRKVKKYMENGSFVPDDLMISFIGEEIQSVANRNWLLDGFPRTLTQAERLQKLQPINLVVNLVVPTCVILDRIKSRWVHLPSGRVYNIGFNDPRVPGKDDVTGEPLSQREDDKLEVVQRRLQDYTMKTEPVVRFYREIGILKDFHGNTTDEMWPEIRKCIAQYF